MNKTERNYTVDGMKNVLKITYTKTVLAATNIINIKAKKSVLSHT